MKNRITANFNLLVTDATDTERELINKAATLSDTDSEVVIEHRFPLDIADGVYQWPWGRIGNGDAKLLVIIADEPLTFSLTTVGVTVCPFTAKVLVMYCEDSTLDITSVACTIAATVDATKVWTLMVGNT